MIKVGIVGATGYTGVELLRLLIQHPQVHIQVVTSRSEVGTPVVNLFPNLRGHLDITFSDPTLENLAECDVLFFATPNGTAMQNAPELLAAGVIE
jgi:N-acetyl-gamma-glutamyl-phosphate reductase